MTKLPVRLLLNLLSFEKTLDGILFLICIDRWKFPYDIAAEDLEDLENKLLFAKRDPPQKPKKTLEKTRTIKEKKEPAISVKFKSEQVF